MPQMSSLIGCMDIIYAYSLCALELSSSGFVKEEFRLGSCFTDGNNNLENHHDHQHNKFLKIAYHE